LISNYEKCLSTAFSYLKFSYSFNIIINEIKVSINNSIILYMQCNSDVFLQQFLLINCSTYVHCPYGTVYSTYICTYIANDKWIPRKMLKHFDNSCILFGELKINKYFKCLCVQQYCYHVSTTYHRHQ